MLYWENRIVINDSGLYALKIIIIYMRLFLSKKDVYKLNLKKK